MKTRYVVTALGTALFFGVLYWITDSFLQFYHFNDNLRYLLFNEPLSINDALVSKIPPHHLITRLIFLAFCLAGGGLVLVFINRWKQSETTFHAYIDSAPNAIFAFDPSGRILDCNESLCKLLQYSDANTKKLSLNQFLSDAESVKKVMRENAASGETMLKRSDGSSVSVLLTTRKIKKSVFIGIATDVTSLTEAREDVQHLNRLLMAIKDINKAITTEIDPDKLITFACRSFTRNLGYLRAWIILTDENRKVKTFGESECSRDIKNLLETKLPRCAEECLEAEHLLVRTYMESCSGCPMQERDKDLTSLCINLTWNDRIYGVMSVAMAKNQHVLEEEKQLITDLADDISHAIHGIEEARSREKAEEALFESEAKYRLITENTLDCITLINSDMVFTYINPAVKRVFGYTPEEWIGTSIADHVTENQRDVIGKILLDSVNSSGEIRTEMKLLHRDGHPVPLDITAKKLKNHRTGQVYYQAVARDLTQKYLAEDRHKKIEEQLRQAQKMEAIGQLAGGLAHDFNNILQSVTGFGEIALSEPDSSAKMKEYLTEILKGSESAASLTRQLLAFSRKQILQKKILDLNSIVTNIMKMIRRTIGENINLTVNTSTEYPIVNADPSQIEQVILNLCVNARDAMPGGGRLIITTGFDSIDNRKMAVLSVEDSGCGMSEQTTRRIFEPFFTTKAPGRGTGLGLSTVIGIIEQHEGSIEVESTVGVGSKFTVFLPLSGNLYTETLENAESPNLQGGTETVLLAEDDSTVRRLTAMILAEAGYTVIQAENGIEALRLFRESGEKIDIVLSDILMPAMGGNDLYRSIQKLRPAKFLFMSGYSSGTLSEEFLSRKGVGFIRKPFTASNLLNSLRKAIEGSN